ncbi:MAG: TRAP transporter fused permease subunit [Sulfolobales archaeon]|nr:TRAP transporter fused permease subunit [Sulfolobales archaeon]MDW8082428.1 TRAP transporter fused permease subunit [Sulfolobales archaeon]
MTESLVVERSKTGLISKVVLVIGVLVTSYEIVIVMGLNFALYTILRNIGIELRFLLDTLDIQQSMAFVLGLVMAVAFLIYPAYKKVLSLRIPIYDYVLASIAFLSMFYLVLVYPSVVRAGYVEATLANILIPTVAIILLLETSRRALGIALPTIAAIILLLGYVFKGFNIRHLVNHIYFAREGIFSTPLFVMVSYVFAFVFFGSILEKIGVGEYITKFVMSLVGHKWGGPAKTAVVASALMGTISGSSVANVLTTGTFTIPLMKKAGYPSEIAGAVEPAASTGGQLMPPIMGAAAFVMAQFLGRPYRDIIIAAVIPAILYFTSIYVFVDRLTKKLNVKPLSRSELPSFKSLVGKIYMLSPIPLITYLLLAGLEPQYCALGSIGAAIASAWIYQRGIPKSTKTLVVLSIVLVALTGFLLGLPVSTAIFVSGASAIVIAIALGLVLRGGRELVKAIISSFDTTIRSVTTIFLAASCAGLIQGTLTLTGWATEIGYRLVDLSGGNLFILMLTAMSISLVLGMGVPTTANYIITSTIVGAPMARAIHQITGIDIEASRLVAHMFVFYFGIMADLTPPVALASYAGSLLARSNFWRTALNATKLAIAGYLVPYIFTLNPAILILTAGAWTLETAFNLIYGLISSILSLLLLSAGIVGWHFSTVGVFQRALLVTMGFILLVPISIRELIAIVTTVTYIALYIYNSRRLSSR